MITHAAERSSAGGDGASHGLDITKMAPKKRPQREITAAAALAAVIAIGDVFHRGRDPTSGWKPAGGLALGMGLMVVLS